MEWSLPSQASLAAGLQPQFHMDRLDQSVIYQIQIDMGLFPSNWLFSCVEEYMQADPQSKAIHLTWNQLIGDGSITKF